MFGFVGFEDGFVGEVVFDGVDFLGEVEGVEEGSVYVLVGFGGVGVVGVVVKEDVVVEGVFVGNVLVDGVDRVLFDVFLFDVVGLEDVFG